jgi:hypothetical protein
MAINAEQYVTTTDSPSFRANSDIEQYHALALVGERSVEPITDGTAEEFIGVAKTSASTGDEVGVKDSNQHAVQVSDDAEVSAPAHLVPSSTAGQLRALNTGGATGETEADSLAMAVTDEDADDTVTANLNRQ